MSISDRKHAVRESPRGDFEIFTGAGRRPSWNAREKGGHCRRELRGRRRACHVEGIALKVR